MCRAWHIVSSGLFGVLRRPAAILQTGWMLDGDYIQNQDSGKVNYLPIYISPAARDKVTTGTVSLWIYQKVTFMCVRTNWPQLPPQHAYNGRKVQ